MTHVADYLSGTDWSAAIAAAIAAGEKDLELPAGDLPCSASVDLGYGVTLRGLGQRATRLVFTGTAYGVGMRYSVPAQYGGWYSRLASLSVVASESLPSADGIVVDVGKTGVRDVAVSGWSRDGVHIDAGSDRTPQTNANHGSWWGVESRDNGRHGFWFKGADSQCHAVVACDASGNAADGFSDESFLGNSFTACHAAHNGAWDYHAEGDSQRCLFSACYSESRRDANGDALPTVKIARSNLWLQGRAVLDPSVQSAQLGAAPGSVSVQSVSGGAPGAVKALLGSSDPSTAITVSAAVGSDTYRMRWATSGGLSGLLAWTWKGVSSLAPLAMTTAAHALGPGYPVMPRGVLLGLGSTQRMVSTAATQPANAAGAVGDLVYCSEPVEGGPSGWQKVTGPNGAYWRPL